MPYPPQTPKVHPGIAAAAEKAKDKPSAKTNVVLDVKGWDDETDLVAMEKGVREVRSPWGCLCAPHADLMGVFVHVSSCSVLSCVPAKHGRRFTRLRSGGPQRAQDHTIIFMRSASVNALRAVFLLGRLRFFLGHVMLRGC